MSVNKAILLGNICQEPTIKSFDYGGKVSQFSLATNKRAYKTKDGKEIPERVEYHNIVINQKGLAEVAEKYLHKGNKVYIEGELRTRQYEDKEGVKHYITEIYVITLEMLTPKAGAQGTGTGTPAPAPEPEEDLPF